jgi:DNA replication and repair protein RecF
MTRRLWVERLTLTDFRNYAFAQLVAGPEPVVLAGANGSGKTNLLEAVSLLGPGQGMRRSAYADLARAGGAGGWAVAGRVHTSLGTVDIGTGMVPPAAGALPSGRERQSRTVRIDGVTQSGTGVLADYVEMVWVTPAMDGLFTGSGTDRRRFLDRLILCFDPGYRTRAGHFERAMQQRNRLLGEGSRDRVQLDGLEEIMAEAGIAIAAARAEAVAGLTAVIAARREAKPHSPFPWAALAMEGRIEDQLADAPAVDVEEDYRRTLRDMRERDRAAGRTLEGPHRSDLVVGHGPKGMPARVSSTGEQKALLLGLILAHAELVGRRRQGTAPLLLLDEVTAHLDAARRASLFDEILALGVQAWMTGTDMQAFSALEARARFFTVDGGTVTSAP